MVSKFFQEKQAIVYDEQKRLAQQSAQIKSQIAKYEDELARKRMQVCDPSGSCAVKQHFFPFFLYTM